MKILSRLKYRHWVIFLGCLLFLAICITTVVLGQIKTKNLSLVSREELAAIRAETRTGAIAKFLELKQLTENYKKEGVDTASIEAEFPQVSDLIFTQDNYPSAKEKTANLLISLEALRSQKLESERLAAELAAKQGSVTGTVKDGDSTLGSVKITLYIGSSEIVSTSTNSTGSYTLSTTAGSYTLAATKSGYTSYRKYNLNITAKQSNTHDISLSKAVVTAPAASSTANSSYERKTISTSRGDFLIDLLTVNLGNGVKVVTDTANDDDCSNNCPTKSLASYVSANGGFAGINGTYFCPADYADCADKKGYFYWKVKNSRLGKMINATNGMGEGDPFLTFSASGQPTYYKTWSSAPSSVYAGISSRPRLIEGGANILNEGELDSKQKNTKSNRGGLAIKGNTLYAVVAKSATVPDLAAVLKALGADYGMNIDGGGSSAIYYNGGYKVGPGRALPNAVVFVGN